MRVKVRVGKTGDEARCVELKKQRVMKKVHCKDRVWLWMWSCSGERRKGKSYNSTEYGQEPN
jgi:hypothetical protein